MPLGAFRINGLAKFTIIAVAEVIRRKVSVFSVGNAQVDTAQSKFGGASALFDGTNDYIQATQPFNLGTDNFTIEMWFRPTARTRLYPALVCNYADGTFTTNSWGLFDRHDAASTKLTFFVRNVNSSNPILTSTTSINNNTWYHVAIVRNGTSLKMYLNGTEEASTTTSASIDGSANKHVFLGKAEADVTSYHGHIDEFRVSNTARYTANFTPSTTPFVNDENTLLLLHMDGTDASTVFEDDNGVRSKIGVTAVGNAQIDTAQSKFGGSSALFDGSSNIVLDNIPTASINEFTFESWIYITNKTTETSAHLFMAGSSSTSEDFNRAYFVYSGAEANRLYFASGNSNDQSFVFWPWNPSINTWYHLAITRDSSNVIRAFVDGTALSGTFTRSYPFLNNQSRLTLGKYRTNISYLRGHLDEFRVSNTARYTAGFTPSTAPFVNDDNTLILLHMDGTDASTVFEDDNGVRSKIGVTAVGNAQIDTAQSKFGGVSVLLDGTDDGLLCNNTRNMIWGSSGNFTYECWARFAATTATYIFDQRTAFGTAAVALLYDSNGLDYYQGGTRRINYAWTPTLNQWYHIALVRNSGTTTLYVDGVNRGNFADTLTYVQGNNSLVVGRWALGSSGFNGHIDEIRVSSTARYTTGFTPPTAAFVNDSDTVLLVHCDGTDGSTVFTDDNGVTPNHNYGA